MIDREEAITNIGRWLEKQGIDRKFAKQLFPYTRALEESNDWIWTAGETEDGRPYVRAKRR